MNGPNDKENEPVERLIEKFDQLLENGDESIPPSEIENLSDEEIVELNRRLNCLQLLDAAREDKKLPPRKKLPPKRDFNDESTWSLREKTLASGRKSGQSKVELPGIEGYRVEKLIGRGGYGNVYQGFDQTLDRRVAIKVPRPDWIGSPQHQTRFRREAKAAAILAHPNIVPLYQSHVTEDSIFLVYGFAEGSTLSNWLSQHGCQDSVRSAKVTATLAEAIQHAHSRGVIHRDLKPGNIMFWSQVDARSPDQDLVSNLCVTDFGLARINNQDQTLTATGEILGTPAYMPPEQATGEIDAVDERSDIYALGTILFELLVGTPPFRKSNPFQTMRAVQTDPVVFPDSPRVPTDLKAVCLKCLEKKPADRYATAQALSDDLNRFVNGQPVSVRAPNLVERTSKWFQRNPITGSLTAALMFSILLGFAGSLYFSISSARNAAVAGENEIKWRQEAFRATRNEELVTEQKQQVEKLLDQSRFTNYGLQMSEAFLLVQSGRIADAKKILESCPLNFRGVEHDIVFNQLGNAPAKIDLEIQVDRCEFSDDCRFLFLISNDTISRVDLGSRKVDSKWACGRITHFAVSPDGQRIVTASEQNVQLWKSNGERLNSLRLSGKAKVDCLTFHVNSNEVLMAISDFGVEPKLVEWQPDSSRLTDVMELESAAKSICISPSGKNIAIAHRYQLAVYEFPGWQFRFSQPFLNPESIQFDELNSRIIFSHAMREYGVLNSSTGDVVATHVAHSNACQVRPVHQSDRIATWDDRSVRIWKPEDNVMTLELKWDQVTPLNCQFVEKLNSLVCPTKSTVLFFDCSAEYSHASIDLQGQTDHLAISDDPDAIWIVGRSNRQLDEKTFHKINWRTAESEQQFVIREKIGREPCIQEGRNQVWVPSHNLMRFDLEGKLQFETELESDMPINKNLGDWQVRVDGQNDRIYVAGQTGIRFYELRGGEIVGKAVEFDVSFVKKPYCVSFDIAEDKQLLTCGFFSGEVVVYDLRTGQTVFVKNFHPESLKAVVHRISFSPDEKSLIATYSALDMIVIETENFQTRFTLDCGGNVARYSNNGRMIAAATSPQKGNSAVIIFDAENGREIEQLLGHQGGIISDLQFSRDDCWLFSGSSSMINSLHIWSLAETRDLLLQAF